jgi:hypothetical protein
VTGEPRSAAFCGCPCHDSRVIAAELTREIRHGAALIAEVETRSSRRLRARLDAELADRLEEARTGRYRSVSERRDAAAARAVAELFGPPE